MILILCNIDYTEGRDRGSNSTCGSVDVRGWTSGSTAPSLLHCGTFPEVLHTAVTQ